MGRNNYFQFKQFKIIQEKSAMKVGTDGALLGAWANVAGVQTILDIGTGTGLIALMLAQRSLANVVGIEIEKNAAEEASENVRNSQWNDRVSIDNISYQEFAKKTNKKFDLLVSNPPFFVNSFKNETESLTMARHNDLLPFNDLISGAVELLSETGRLSVILPNLQATNLIDLAESEGLFLNRITKVKPKPSKSANRFLIEFSKIRTVVEENKLIIYAEDSSDYTEMYKEITHDFYLKF